MGEGKHLLSISWIRGEPGSMEGDCKQVVDGNHGRGHPDCRTANTGVVGAVFLVFTIGSKSV